MENKFVDKRFNPEKEPEKWKTWQKSEKRRVLVMHFRRGYVSVQNYFWPTKLTFLPVMFVGILFLERMLLRKELLWESLGLSCLKSSALTLMLVHLRHEILYLLLQYRTWIFEVRPSAITKLWFTSVGLVSSKITNWLTGNWLLPSLPAPQLLQDWLINLCSRLSLVFLLQKVRNWKRWRTTSWRPWGLSCTVRWAACWFCNP